MAYTTVPTFTDTSATAANGNTYIRDNQRALKDPPSQNYESNEGANYTRTGSAAFANVDADFNFSITTTGGDVIVSFVGVAFATSGGGIPLIGYFDVSVDGTRIINNANGGLAVFTGAKTLVQFTRLVTGLAAGVHTFNLQWAVEDAVNTITLYAGAGTASYDLHPQFWVRELT
jgi:hypothetical protein